MGVRWAANVDRLYALGHIGGVHETRFTANVRCIDLIDMCPVLLFTVSVCFHQHPNKELASSGIGF